MSSGIIPGQGNGENALFTFIGPFKKWQDLSIFQQFIACTHCWEAFVNTRPSQQIAWRRVVEVLEMQRAQLRCTFPKDWQIFSQLLFICLSIFLPVPHFWSWRFWPPQSGSCHSSEILDSSAYHQRNHNSLKSLRPAFLWFSYRVLFKHAHVCNSFEEFRSF